MIDYPIIPISLYTNNLTIDLRPVPLVYDDILEGQYLISPFGHIYSIAKNKVLKPFTNGGGYNRICLITKSGKRNFSIHRLVAYTFIYNPDPSIYTDVNHIDGVKNNNAYYNLEWCTNNQNKHHASVTGLYQHGEERYNAVYTDDFAREICEKFEYMQYEDVYRYYQNIYPNTSSTIGSFVYKLYHRKTRNHITCLYNY